MMSEHFDYSQVSDGQLRAWADFGVISSARYVDEMVKRGKIVTQITDAPSIEPNFDELFGDLDLTGFEFLAGVDIAPHDEVRQPFEARPMFGTVGGITIGAVAILGIILVGIAAL